MEYLSFFWGNSLFRVAQNKTEQYIFRKQEYLALTTPLVAHSATTGLQHLLFSVFKVAFKQHTFFKGYSEAF